MNRVGSIVSGKRLVSASLLVSLIAVAIWHTTAHSTPAQSTGGFEGAILNVTPDAKQTFDINSVAPGAAFSVTGTISTATGGTGVFYRTGVRMPSPSTAAVVQDVYVLQSFNGAIMAEGVLNPALIGVIEQANLTAATGGIGTFRGAQGEMQITTNADGSFTARLMEVPRRIGDDRRR